MIDPALLWCTASCLHPRAGEGMAGSPTHGPPELIFSNHEDRTPQQRWSGRRCTDSYWRTALAPRPRSDAPTRSTNESPARPPQRKRAACADTWPDPTRSPRAYLPDRPHALTDIPVPSERARSTGHTKADRNSMYSICDRPGARTVTVVPATTDVSTTDRHHQAKGWSNGGTLPWAAATSG